jgi:hypothetical protein
LIEQIAAAKKLMLVPETRHQRRRFRKRGVQMPGPVDPDYATGGPPKTQYSKCERRPQGIHQTPAERHSAAGSSFLAIEVIAQASARAWFSHEMKKLGRASAREARSFRDRRTAHKVDAQAPLYLL